MADGVAEDLELREQVRQLRDDQDRLRQEQDRLKNRRNRTPRQVKGSKARAKIPSQISRSGQAEGAGGSRTLKKPRNRTTKEDEPKKKPGSVGSASIPSHSS